jgi:quinolinate synthase
MLINDQSLAEKGFLDVKLDPAINLLEEIEKLKKEKNAIILGHYYQTAEIQDISDFVGDSLALAQQAAKTQADVIVFAGVHFMAETAKILSPDKTVLLPDLNAGCSLAESAPADEFKKFRDKHPDHFVISYVNTSAAIKALTDVVCTSTNAKQIVDSFPKEQKLIFAPDKNLGNYINSITGREMVLWNGACHVHEQFSLEKILKLKEENADAKILAHPECEKPILMVADHIGSTSSILNYTINSKHRKFIVATESGIIHQMQKSNPQKLFIPAPPNDSTCACNDCNFMKLNTLEKLYICMKYGTPQVILDESLRVEAEKPIRRMLDISEKLGL